MLFLPLQSSTRRANCHGRFNGLTVPTWAANTSTVRQRANRKLFLEDGLFLEAWQSFCAAWDSASMKRTSAFPLAKNPHKKNPAILVNVKLTIWKGYIVFSLRVCSWLEHQMGLAGCVALEGFSAFTHHDRCCLECPVSLLINSRKSPLQHFNSLSTVAAMAIIFLPN